MMGRGDTGQAMVCAQTREKRGLPPFLRPTGICVNSDISMVENRIGIQLYRGNHAVVESVLTLKEKVFSNFKNMFGGEAKCFHEFQS